jgi:hypothetical protein
MKVRSIVGAVSLCLALLGCGNEPAREDRPGGAPGQPAAASRGWTCPMHPEVVRDGPGSCPSCGMDLVARDQP